MKRNGLSNSAIPYLVIAVLVILILFISAAQYWVETGAITPSPNTSSIQALKERREIDKLVAEIRRIRSDTAGSLFWLKVIALFVTVGGAVGGYLVGQSRTTHARIDFEDRKNVDAVYQSILQELSSEAPLLRAAAAVKLGTILKSFPDEWSVSQARRDQLIQLTKQVLAASLAIEEDSKVLKMLTIALVQHHPWEDDPDAKGRERYGDGRGLDLSGAKAADAYWARVDFTYADFYKANLSQVSFRQAILQGAQLREAELNKAVLIQANCEGANFKLADLRDADLTGATLVKASFEGAKVHGAILMETILGSNPEGQVDIAPAGGKPQMISVTEWLAKCESIRMADAS